MFDKIHFELFGCRSNYNDTGVSHRLVKKQIRRISPEVGSTHFQPSMLDMDLFGGKKDPDTKYP